MNRSFPNGHWGLLIAQIFDMEEKSGKAEIMIFALQPRGVVSETSTPSFVSLNSATSIHQLSIHHGSSIILDTRMHIRREFRHVRGLWCPWPEKEDR
jgi:hypothetical protein